MTYTPEQHAEAMEWVQDRLEWHESWVTSSAEKSMPVLVGVLRTETIALRYLLSRLEAHTPGDEWWLTCTCGRNNSCRESKAALDAVAELRAA